tara:strand:- start:134 stop:1492 length:1359 start_codon:yes stop_codon:yes gene_type:complete
MDFKKFFQEIFYLPLDLYDTYWAVSLSSDSEHDNTLFLVALLDPYFIDALTEKQTKVLLHKLERPIVEDKAENFFEIFITLKSNKEKHLKIIEEHMDYKSGIRYKKIDDKYNLDESGEWVGVRYRSIRKKEYKKLALHRYRIGGSGHRKITGPESFTPEVSKIYSKTSNFFISLTALYGGITSSSISKDVDKFTSEIFGEAHTIYTSSIDANYNATNVGGAYHRLLDESHSPFAMLKKVKDADPNDSKFEEIINWLNEMAKDLQTTMGLPLVSISEDTFNSAAKSLEPFGISKSELYDFSTFNLHEFLSFGLGGMTWLFPSIRKNKKKLGTLIGIIGSSSILSANPLSMMLLLMMIVVSIIKKDFKNNKKEMMAGIAQGTIISIILKMAFGLFDDEDLSKTIGIIVAFLMIIFLISKAKLPKDKLKKASDRFAKHMEELKDKSSNLLENVTE